MLKVSFDINVLLERETIQNRKMFFVPFESKLEFTYIDCQNIDWHLHRIMAIYQLWPTICHQSVIGPGIEA